MEQLADSKIKSLENWQDTSTTKKTVVKFLDPVYDKTEEVLKYKISFIDGEEQEIFEINKSVEELLVLFGAMETESRLRLFTQTKILEFISEPNYNDLVSFKPILQEAFEEIMERRDTRINNLLHNFCRNLPLVSDDFFPLSVTVREHISEQLNMGDLQFDEEHQIYLACAENSSALARAGRVWSLIESETNGLIKIFRISKETLMPSFIKLLKQEYDDRCGACLYHSKSKMVYVGFNTGKICYFKLNESNEKDTKVEAKNIIEEPILGFQFLSKELCEFIIFSENNIKILNASGKIIGGGSLRKRLDGAYLTTLAVDASRRTLLLGTSSGYILIYSYMKSGEEYSLKFVRQIEIKDGSSIECISVKGSFVLVGCRLSVDIYSYDSLAKEEMNLKSINQFGFEKKQTKEFVGDEFVTQVGFIKSKRILVGTLSNGLMVFWSSDFGTMIGAMKAHDDSIIRLSIDEKSETIITAGWNTQIKVWKYGSRE